MYQTLKVIMKFLLIFLGIVIVLWLYREHSLNSQIFVEGRLKDEVS